MFLQILGMVFHELTSLYGPLGIPITALRDYKKVDVSEVFKSDLMD